MPSLPASFKDKRRAVRDAIVTKLETVDGIGNVHPRIRWSSDPEAMKALVGFDDPRDAGTDRLAARYAYVMFDPFRDESETVACTAMMMMFRIGIVHSFVDERADESNSTDDFDDLVADIADAFRMDRHLGFDDLYHFLIQGEQPVELELNKDGSPRGHFRELTIEFDVGNGIAR